MQNQKTLTAIGINPLLHGRTIKVGSLFSGIGGFELGFQMASPRYQIEWQVEIDEYCRNILERHWPLAKRWDDVRTFEPTPVDVLVGGFPCQDVSQAGKRVGIEGERSGLWSEFHRIIRRIRPRIVIVENVAGLLVRGLDRVLGDLASIGYDAEWECIPAVAVGAPHVRDRVWIAAYPNADSRRFEGITQCDSPAEAGQQAQQWNDVGGLCDDLADAAMRCERQRGREQLAAYGEACRRLYWPETESGVQRVADGVPDRVDRIKCCGNAIVPHVAAWIGERIARSM